MSTRALLHPAEIRKKAERQYSRFLSAWMTGETYFPLQIPGIGIPDSSLAIAQQQVQALRAGSKEVLGYGYTVEWQERNSRHHGRNQFPERVIIENQEDFLRLLGRQREFVEFAVAVAAVRARFPVLEDWLRRNQSVLMRHREIVPGLLDVVEYFHQHPRPGLFAREIPLAVDTKFIQQNAGVLEQWLNIVLSPSSIRSDERHFERRFGLRYAEPLIILRFLDLKLQQQFGSPWRECGVPLHVLAETRIDARRVIIVENKVNLLTFPALDGAIALGGLGNGIVDLSYVNWLGDLPLWYWGDLDVEGFEILSRLRIRFPQTHSFLMDEATVLRWQHALGSGGTGRSPDPPAQLTLGEMAAFRICAEQNLRIEQERIPQSAVVEAVSRFTW